nr:MAG TPA: hypothetical protein [Caudoviricetes sp.]
MAEYIKRETAVKAANEWVSEACMAPVMRVSRLLDKLQKVPASDVAPVVHAQWIEDGSGIIICPECKRGYNLIAKYTHYCPNCGAKMDGGAGNG